MDGLVKQLKERFPSIDWSIHPSTPEIEKDYGKGKLLRGHKAGKFKDFYILDKDKKKLRWGVVIAHALGDKNVESSTDTK